MCRDWLGVVVMAPVSCRPACIYPALGPRPGLWGEREEEPVCRSLPRAQAARHREGAAALGPCSANPHIADSAAPDSAGAGHQGHQTTPSVAEQEDSKDLRASHTVTW